MKATRLTDEFTFDAFNELYGDRAVPLLLLGDDDRLSVISVDQPTEPQPGQSVISLVKEETPAEVQEKQIASV